MSRQKAEKCRSGGSGESRGRKLKLKLKDTWEVGNCRPFKIILLLPSFLLSIYPENPIIAEINSYSSRQLQIYSIFYSLLYCLIAELSMRQVSPNPPLATNLQLQPQFNSCLCADQLTPFTGLIYSKLLSLQ